MSRLLCRVGWHRWYLRMWYQVKGRRWGVERCRRCGKQREFQAAKAAS